MRPDGFCSGSNARMKVKPLQLIKMRVRRSVVEESVWKIWHSSTSPSIGW
jgi:hypothetical protein